MREKREHQRVRYSVPVTIHPKTEGEALCVGVLEDISLGGVFLTASETPPIGIEVRVAFELPTLGLVVLPGFVRWVKANGFGIQFGLMGPRETHSIGKLVRGSHPSLGN